MTLTGRAAVVTGGGRGIGAAIARRLAAAGARLLVASRHEREVLAVADEVRRAGQDASAAVCDVTDAASVARLATTAWDRLGDVDILVNNAGSASSAPIVKLTLEEWQRLWAVNATGTFLCTQAFLPPMLHRSWGRIVNIASLAGLTGAKYIAAYSAAKHAVVGFTRSVAAEVAEHGVTVNAVCPGYVESTLTEETLTRIMNLTGRSRDQALAAVLAQSGQPRLVTPDEVAALVLSLCRPEAGTVTGQAIVLDAGALGS